MAYDGGLEGILTGLTKSTDHPSTGSKYHYRTYTDTKTGTQESLQGPGIYHNVTWTVRLTVPLVDLIFLTAIASGVI